MAVTLHQPEFSHLTGHLLLRRKAQVRWHHRKVVLNLKNGSIAFYKSTDETKRHTSKLSVHEDNYDMGDYASLVDLITERSWTMKDIVNSDDSFIVEFCTRQNRSNDKMLQIKNLFQRSHDDSLSEIPALPGSSMFSRTSSIVEEGNNSSHTFSVDSSRQSIDADNNDAESNSFSFRGSSNLDAESGHTSRLYLKCLQGGNEKAMWRDAAKKLNSFEGDEFKIGIGIKPSSNIPWRYRNWQTRWQPQDQTSLSTGLGAEDTLVHDTGKVKQYKVLPADIYRNQFMTKKELEEETMMPSTKFYNLRETTCHKDGKNPVIGSLKVEVLSCHGLPKLDLLSDTDAVVYLVCGACAFTTDVIMDCNSPRWPCKARRAAIFPLRNAYARLFAGVFDNDGDFSGRVMIDVASLRPDRVYDVVLPLRETAQVYFRRRRGAIRLRYHITWDNERAAVLSYLPTLDPVTVACGDRHAFRCVATTVHGADMPGKFSKTIADSTLRELKLVKVQLEALAKKTVKDIRTWENPVVSAFIFFGWMHSVQANSPALVYPYFFGYIVLCLLKNYSKSVRRWSLQSEFSPLTLEELFMSLFRNSKKHGSQADAPIPSQTTAASSLLAYLIDFLTCYEADNGINLDHEEFPFSEGNKYTKLRYEDCRAKATSNGKTADTFGDSDDEDDVFLMQRDENSSRAEQNDAACLKQAGSIPAGPEQNLDLPKTKEKNFDQKAIEKKELFHKITMRLFDDRVYIPVEIEDDSKPYTDLMESHLLGMRASVNPLMLKVEQYIGPVNEILNIGLRVIRSIFNLFMWKDPFISFWFLVCCICLIIVFSIFPWRWFMFVLGIALVGPQNWILRSWKKSCNQSSVGQLSPEYSSQFKTPKKMRNFPFLKKNKNLKNTPADKECYEPIRTTYASPSLNDKKSDLFEVVVPYCPLRQERFYDWPPEPSRSSVTITDNDGYHLHDMAAVKEKVN